MLNVFNWNNKKVEKTEIEAVEAKKNEWRLLDSFMRTNGLNLYRYDPIKDEIEELVPKKVSHVNMTGGADGLSVDRYSQQNITVKSTDILFETLNIKNAIKKVENFKSGKTAQLANLRKPCEKDQQFLGKI